LIEYLRSSIVVGLFDGLPVLARLNACDKYDSHIA
jgi:hypothetical protein